MKHLWERLLIAFGYRSKCCKAKTYDVPGYRGIFCFKCDRRTE